MLKKILVPTDGSELSRKAIDGAVDVATRLGSSLIGIRGGAPLFSGWLLLFSPAALASFLDGTTDRAKPGCTIAILGMRPAGREAAFGPAE